jgi:hypothetical protein
MLPGVHTCGVCRDGCPLWAAAVRSAEVSGFPEPARVFSRDEVLSQPSAVPAASGVYGWWSCGLPALIDTAECRKHGGLALLHAGISPAPAAS